MKTPTLRWLPPLILMASLLPLAGCPRPADAPAPPAQPTPEAPANVKLQLNWFPEPEFGGIYAARERGIFTRHGLNVELLSGGADVPAPQLLASGRVEFAVLAAEQVLTLRAKGGRVKAVFASFQTSPRCVVVRGESPYLTLDQLWEGKATVLAQDGLTFIRWLNHQHGGTGLSFVPYAGSAAPLLSGAVDAMQGFATAEPVQLAADGVAIRSFLVAESGYNPYDVVVCVNEAYLATSEPVARALVAALREGWRSYLDDPAPINAAMAELNRDMKPDVMARSAEILPEFIESEATATHGPGWMAAARWEELARQLVAVGELDASVDPAAAFVNLPPPGAP